MSNESESKQQSTANANAKKKRRAPKATRKVSWKTVLAGLPKGLRLAFRRGAVFATITRSMEQTEKQHG
jgi:hypothetical protein